MVKKKRICIFVAGILAAFCLGISGAIVYGQSGGEIDAKSLFEYHCATCHGADGKGTKRGRELKAPNLADADWQAKTSDAQVLNSIMNGKNKMPRWSDKLQPEEIQALAKYVRKLAPRKRP